MCIRDRYIRISYKTANGVSLGTRTFADTESLDTNYGPMMTIWYESTPNHWAMHRQFRIESFRWNYNQHMEFGLGSSHGWSIESLEDRIYYMNIAGFF